MLAGNSSDSPMPGDRSPERARGFWRTMSIAVRLSIGFILVAAVPLLVGGILSLYTLQYVSTMAVAQSEASLSALGEASISQAAEATAHQVELYLSMHPEIDLTNMAQLEKNASLAKIAVQPVGKTGYTAVFDDKGFTHFHSNPSMVGKDMSTLAGELPEFWAIFAAALDGSPSKGYYQWKDADGKIRSKYMSIVPVGNTPLRVAATTYMDEFSQPVAGMRTHLADVQKTVSLRLLLLLGVAILTSSAGAVIVGRQVSRPIRQVTDAATRLAAGDLSVRAPVTSGDELGNLAASFNQMADRVGGLLQSLQAKNVEAEKRTAQLEANQRAIQVIFSASGSSKTDELLGLVVNLIRDRFNLYHVQMYLVDDQQQAAVLHQSTGYAGQQLLMKKHQIPLERTSLVTKAIHEGAPVLVEDVRQDPSFLANPLLPDTRSELAVPLKVGDKVAGVLDAQSREAGFFTPDMVALFETMTNQVGLLFKNSELFTRITQQSESLSRFAGQLNTAAQVAHRLGSILDPELLMSEVVELLQSRFGLYHVHVYVLDEAAQDLVVRAGSGEVGRVLRERGHKIALQADKSLVARAARNRQTVVVNDASLESDFMPNPLLPQTRSEMAVPLIAGDRVIGVLDVQDDKVNRFSQSEVDVFGTLAGQVATALQNAQLFEARKRAEERIRTFQALIENAAEGIAMADLEGRLTYVNRAFCQQTGYDYERREMNGLPLTSIWTDEDLPRVTEKVLPQVMAGGRSSEGRVKRRDGSVFDAQVSAFPVLDEGGRLICTAAILRDITERKQAEAALREANARVQAVLDAATQMAVISTDPNGLITVFNTGAERMLGYSAEEMVGKQSPAIIHLESEVVARGKELTAEFGRPIEGFDIFVEYARQGKYEERDWTYVTKDGKHLIVTLTVTARRDSTGRITGFLGMAKDVTERKQAEEAVRESRQRFQGLVETLSDWIWEVDQNGVYTYVSPKVKDLLGYEPEEVLGKTPFDLMPAEEAQRVAGVFGPLLSTQQPLVALENTNRHKDGHLMVLETSGLPFFDAQGQLKGYRGTDRDITERKQAEELIQKRAAELQTVAKVGTAASTVLETDKLLQTVVDLTQSDFHLYHAHIYLLDEAADALVLAAGAGQVGQQMVAEGWRIPLNREQSLVAQAARTRQGVIVNDVRAEPDFMPNPLLPDTRSELAVPLIVGEKVLGVLDVQSDQVGRFTEEDVAIQTTLASQIATALENARLFEETKHIAERLREVDRLKTEFLANMSHELRTPLNSIIGYAEVLLMGIDGTLEPETQEDVQAIFDNGHHLLSLINDILDLAKIEAGSMTLQPEEVDVVQLLDEVKSNSLGLLHKTKKPVELSVNIEGDVKPVWADRLRINQVLNNLVSNAVKFTDQGSVTLRVFSENGWVCIQVQDTGCGIGEADLSKLFEKFRQVDGSHKRRAEGTGLGLAITRYLVEMHGGTISVQSRLGQGSTFTVRLPATAQPVEPTMAGNN